MKKIVTSICLSTLLFTFNVNAEEINMNTTSEKILEMSNTKDLKLKLEIVKHPNTPEEVLEKYSKDFIEDVRVEVARRIKNPVILEEFFNNEKFAFVKAVIDNPNTPISILDKCDDEKLYIIREHILQNKKMPLHVLVKYTNKYANSNDTNTKYLIAIHPNASQSILKQLSKDKNETVVIGVIKNPNTPVEMIEELYDKKKYLITLEIASNLRTPVDLLKKIYIENKDSSSVKIRLLNNPNLPSDIFDSILNSNDSTTQNALIKDPNTPSKILSKLFYEKNSLDKNQILRNPNVSIELLESLYNETRYREAIASNVKTPLDVLKRFLKEDDSGTKYVTVAVLKNPNIPNEILEPYLESERINVFRAVLNNPNLDPKHLERIVKSGSWALDIAGNSNTPINILNDLLNHKSTSVQIAVVNNKSTTIEMLEIASKSKIKDVRKAVAENVRTPIQILNKLKEDKDDDVYYAVVKNPTYKQNK